ncbi:MAG TPA: DUF2203 domain-containing protein [Anaerolineales bacterium]|nr:DUF2203 domain-containing protein [Anaerolineales bacterium]
MEAHYFTLEEANSALRIIRPLIEEILSIRDDILAHKPEVWPAIERSAGNGGNATLSRVAEHFDRLDKLVHRVLDTGVQVKDINTGLLDFPAWRVDHEVYLCWKYGEDQVRFWHEIDAGFAGRQPIEAF